MKARIGSRTGDYNGALMPNAKYTVVSLFSGAMGLDIGLEQTGRFRTLACVEKEPAFCETIRLNRDAGRLRRSFSSLKATSPTWIPLTSSE